MERDTEAPGERPGRAAQEALTAELERIRQECRARAVFLVDASGRPLARSPADAPQDQDAAASLAASLAAAAQAIGTLFGVERVDTVIQEGRRDAIRLMSDGDLVLAVVYGEHTLEGLEALRARLRKRGALRRIRKLVGAEGAGILEGVRSEEIEAFLENTEQDPHP